MVPPGSEAFNGIARFFREFWKVCKRISSERRALDFLKYPRKRGYFIFHSSAGRGASATEGTPKDAPLLTEAKEAGRGLCVPWQELSGNCPLISQNCAKEPASFDRPNSLRSSCASRRALTPSPNGTAREISTAIDSTFHSRVLRSPPPPRFFSDLKVRPLAWNTTDAENMFELSYLGLRVIQLLHNFHASGNLKVT